MNRFVTISILFLFTSCLLMPPGAPHYHSYQSKTNNIKVEVFCTAGKKRYHLFYDDYANVEVCSKVFGKDDCFIFKRDSFFKQMKYQKTIRIGDVKFHKLFKKDTLKVSLINSGKVFELFPVE